MLTLESSTNQTISFSEDDERGSGRVQSNDERGSGRLDRLPYIEQFFATDRITWKLLSLQTRLKKAKSPQVRRAIALDIERLVRETAILYSNLRDEAYCSGVQFGRESAEFMRDAEQFAQRSGARVAVHRTTRGLSMSVNGRSID